MLNRMILALSLISLPALAQADFNQYDSQPQLNQAPPSTGGDYGNALLPESQPGPAVNSVDDFNQQLAPYGAWVNENNTMVWQPSPAVVGSDFTPYATQGQWVATTAGWEFQSSLPFGSNTFHYGRWYRSQFYGWVWVPDTQWGPSWVEWRYGGGYTGWAPLPPRYLTGGYRPNWFFVSSANLGNSDVYRYNVNRNLAWGLTIGLPVRGGYHVGPSFRDWHTSYGRTYRPPAYGYRGGGYDRGGGNAPPPPGYSRGPGGAAQGGYHPPPPPPMSNRGGVFGGGARPPPPMSSGGMHGFPGGAPRSGPPPAPVGGGHFGGGGTRGGGHR